VRAAVLLVVLVLCACGGSPPATAHTPTPGASASPLASPTAGPASLVHCAAAVPAGDNLVIGSVVGDPTIVVRDIQDPAHARNVCTFDSSVLSPQFVSGSRVAYETADNQIVEADLAGGATTLLATYTSGFDSGQYAFSPDGKSLTYLDTDGWHVAGPSGHRLLATLPAAPGRGVSPNQDDSYLAFSPDGVYIAYVQTFHVGGAGATAAGQIRKASDGSLVYSTSGMTMAVWASVPSRLFFRDATGDVKRWDPSGGVSSMTKLNWVRPKASPDGRWIAYTYPTSGGVGAIGFYSVQANGTPKILPPGRSGARFLTNDLVWYIGERACATCFGGQPQSTGVTYIYSIAGASEVTSRLASVSDVWPHVTAPAL
jgi:Tol biopolymer transport system component